MPIDWNELEKCERFRAVEAIKHFEPRESQCQQFSKNSWNGPSVEGCVASSGSTGEQGGRTRSLADFSQQNREESEDPNGETDEPRAEQGGYPGEREVRFPGG